jgi:leucyl-tRNA synthetase
MNFKQIEKKWQKFWEEKALFQAEDFCKKPKKYILIEFPYLSGDGLHVGHCRSYIALDTVARRKRMEGYNVLFPIGWDAFGLPAENYAIKTGIHPEKTVTKNIANYKRQMKALGLSFDWSREINTTDSQYYKWTQWIFLKLFENGLAYQAEIPINWCPACKIGLANEEVVVGCCERCGAAVEKKILKQWLLKITAYADQLIDDLEEVNYPNKVKTQQIEWIGKSYGTEIVFPLIDSEEKIKVFTTRADTLFGVTAVVLAPEHPFVASLLKITNHTSHITNIEEVKKYIEEARKKSDFEREKLEKDKTGVFSGLYCLNPANNKKVPVWIADYVIATYGGGAVMMVPAHDFRDYEFAQKFKLPIRKVIEPEPLQYFIRNPKDIAAGLPTELKVDSQCWEGEGVLINSSQFNRMQSEKARKEITNWLAEKNLGRKKIQYKLRDWIFSRQHYWGEPIPLVFCSECKKRVEISNFQFPNSKQITSTKFQIQNLEFNLGEILNPGWISIPENDLPVELPYVEKYQPTETGESPLSAIKEWVNVKCPKCSGEARRETDTMPNWAGSNWYYLAYAFWHKLEKQKSKSKNQKENVFNKYKQEITYWLPVDWYNGGFEHTTLHLLYSRFIYKFLHNISLVPGSEPYKRRTSHGVILAEDNRKMSKSLGNVVNPDDIIKNYGADTLRLYGMFIGPFEQAIAWNTKGIKGCYRFLEKVWKLKSKVKMQKSKPQSKNQNLEKLIHKTIKKIDEDLENCKFNTAVSALMILINEMEKEESLEIENWKLIIKLLAPFAPHLAEELWYNLGYHTSIFEEKWPQYDEEKMKEEKITLVLQVNGKVRAVIEVEKGITKDQAEKFALHNLKVKKYLESQKIKNIIYVPDKLINIVV